MPVSSDKPQAVWPEYPDADVVVSDDVVEEVAEDVDLVEDAEEEEEDEDEALMRAMGLPTAFGAWAFTRGGKR